MNRFPNINKSDFGYNWYFDKLNTDLKINKQTKIVSMGSCFAGEIKNHLVNAGYSYLQEEDDKEHLFADDCSYRKASHRKRLGSCAWERVFTLPCFRQIMEYTFGAVNYPDRLLDAKNGCHDLLRTKIIYKNKKIATKDIPDHIEKSQKVLSGCDVFIFTMGLVEIWEMGQMVLATSPQHGRYKADCSFRVQKYDEIMRDLERGYNLWRAFNKNARFILTVSPVHMMASYREDVDVLSATCYSKSVLRAVANDFVADHPEVSYFPSYEIVVILANILGDIAYPDGHHVNDKIIKAIMEIFENTFCV